MFKSLNRKQKIILLLIAGISSVVGLSDLSQYYRDYYTGAAFLKTILTAVLLFVIFSPFYFGSIRKLIDFINNFIKHSIVGTILDKLLLLIVGTICAFVIAGILLFLTGNL